MPTVLDMEVGGIHLNNVIGKAYRRSSRIRVSERVDGSSLNIGKVDHFVAFTLQPDLLPLLKPKLQLNSFIPFSARYSTGESLTRATAQVRDVNLMDSGDIEYTLSIGPNEAVLDGPAPG